MFLKQQGETGATSIFIIIIIFIADPEGVLDTWRDYQSLEAFYEKICLII